MDVAQGLFEVEVLILLGRGDADIAARGQAPVGGLDLGTGDGLAQPRYGRELGVGKAVLQPDDLAVEVDGELELLDRGLALFVELLDAAGCGARSGSGSRVFLPFSRTTLQ